MKLKGQSMGSRTKKVVKRLQHQYGNNTGHGPKEERYPKKEMNLPKYSIVFRGRSCTLKKVEVVRLNFINYLVGFIPCQICLYFSN